MSLHINVLDHGYVSHIESWGTGETGTIAEAGIIEAARQSTQGSFRGWEKDEKLLAFLFNNKPPHATPFEFAGMTIEIQAPIFVFREHQRHRTQSYNEMSARYAPLPDLAYIPTVERCFLTQEKNKQAQGIKGASSLEIGKCDTWRANVQLLYDEIENLYQEGLADGIPKELARIILPVGRYSRMRASANLRNWLQFLTLRMHPDAQWEIRQFANAVGDIIKVEFPRTWKLFSEREL